MNLLIINADDFGYGPGLNHAILDSYQLGVLTSTTLMANMPGFDQAVAMAKENPGLGIGVHLVLTCGTPILKTGSSITTDQGDFKKISFYEEHFEIDPDELYKEWHAQIDRVFAAGLTPDHLDSHHHVDMLPAIQPVYERLAREFGLPVRRNYEVPSDIKSPAHLDDAFDHLGLTKAIWKPMTTRNLIEDVHACGSVEAMCHPGYVDAELNSRSSLTTNRVYTARELQRPEYKVMMKNEGITLGRFSDL
ncbi:carbohydrate deacetylase [Lacticaseibacillus daqingensis]|uniref:carbohydrate deacetylase n=1 Tax=Lacticaseibacillus daqingensis TaxID=2486014 RepID=UPI000F7AF796|nr:carbohydrate deacetylase [Lacticaseibacillus daqingensis]